jgi:hypothetical protein
VSNITNTRKSKTDERETTVTPMMEVLDEIRLDVALLRYFNCLATLMCMFSAIHACTSARAVA